MVFTAKCYPSTTQPVFGIHTKDFPTRLPAHICPASIFARTSASDDTQTANGSQARKLPSWSVAGPANGAFMIRPAGSREWQNPDCSPQSPRPRTSRCRPQRGKTTATGSCRDWWEVIGPSPAETSWQTQSTSLLEAEAFSRSARSSAPNPALRCTINPEIRRRSLHSPKVSSVTGLGRLLRDCDAQPWKGGGCAGEGKEDREDNGQVLVRTDAQS